MDSLQITKNLCRVQNVQASFALRLTMYCKKLRSRRIFVQALLLCFEYFVQCIRFMYFHEIRQLSNQQNFTFDSDFKLFWKLVDTLESYHFSNKKCKRQKYCLIILYIFQLKLTVQNDPCSMTGFISNNMSHKYLVIHPNQNYL